MSKTIGLSTFVGNIEYCVGAVRTDDHLRWVQVNVFHYHLDPKWDALFHQLPLSSCSKMAQGWFTRDFCRPLATGHQKVFLVYSRDFSRHKRLPWPMYEIFQGLSRESPSSERKTRLWLIVSGTWSFSSLLSYSVKIVDCDLCKQTIYNCSRFFGQWSLASHQWHLGIWWSLSLDMSRHHLL